MENFTNMDQTNKDDLKYIISLKKLKKDGTLDSDEYMQCQKSKWRNTLNYTSLKQWLTSNSEELRLHTLELLVISKKSTLSFIETELNLIDVFLRFNFREKIEYVPLIKKVLKRLNDSYAVLKRQLEKENKLKELQKLHPELEIPSDNTSNVAKSYQSFVHVLHRMCLVNLYPGAVNIRQKSSLQILCLMTEILSDDLKSSLWELDHLEHLFDCLLLDTYEVNKEMAFSLIKSSNLVEAFFDIKEKVLELVDVAVQMGNSIRPLDSITAAYMLKISMLSSHIQEVLLELTKFKKVDCIKEKITFYMITLLKTCLEKPVQFAVKNIVIAASKHSLYGYIFCIRSILSTINFRSITNDESWKDLITGLVNMCFELNIAVSQIVNNSSPEGHLPMDLNPRHLNGMVQDAEEIVITPQMVLLCSWRTVKEISLLFGHITSNASIFNEKTKSGLLKESQIKEIGNVFVTLLFETKHRGAFEQAHVGFGQLCSRLWHIDSEQVSLKQLPKMWLQQLMLAVIGLTLENSKLCATRRSAGVPFMVQALVTSEIRKRCDTKALTFHSVMRILLKLSNVEDDFNLNDAENLLFNESLFVDYDKSQYTHDLGKGEERCIKLNEITEIKTHSLNILRALYRHYLLGELVKDYIAEGFITAFKSYDGKSWAERNAATLLFSSLVVRVFGVQRTKDHVNLTLHNRMTGRNFFEKFPILLPFLLNELTIFIHQSEDQIKPKIQSILLILSRLYPSVTFESTDEDWKIDQFIDLVSKCGKSRIYKTRELAARALVPLLTESNVAPISCNLLNLMIISPLPLNLLHGYTLQLLEIVRSPQFAKVELPHEQLQAFINFLSTKILHNLENANDGPACFLVSTEALEIHVELSKINAYSWIYKDSVFLSLLENVQSHLTSEKALKKRPGIELYETTAVYLLFTALDNENYDGSLLNNEYISTQFWERILSHKNKEVLTVSWSKFLCIVHKMNSSMLYDLGFITAVNTLDIPVDDPDLQDAIFEFIYDCIKKIEQDHEYIRYTFSKEEEKNYMCMHIFNKLSQRLKMPTFYPRGAFFKLFGKTFGFLLKNFKDTEILKESKTIIYDAFLNQSSMESNFDFRLGISEVLFDLYIDISKKNDIYFILNWWTTLVQLLYDDNVQIRSNASEIVCKLSPKNKLNCEALVVDKFFEKFAWTFKQNLEALGAALFCWSMTAATVFLEEMNETDVFNKSCNYECFEPLQIVEKCADHLNLALQCYESEQKLTSIPLSKAIKEWVQKQLDLDDNFDFANVGDLILKYKNLIPDTEKPLKRILDPIYPAKLIKEMAYLDFRKLVTNENDSN